MKILSIETSCDDTGVSILEAKGGVKSPSFRVLANNLNSQVNIHIPYGGVYPVLAKREHAKNLPIVLEASLKQAKLTHDNKPVAPIRGREGSQRPSASNGIDAIAVTYGPGLEMCLWEGITFAKDLAKKWKVPLIPTNHMEGHILSVFGKDKGTFKIQKLQTPTLALLISGGHTQLVLMKKPARLNPARPILSGWSRSGGWMDYEIIGETLDDAVGEAFDKVARMLDLPYPGGPQISKLAESVREKENKVFRGRNFSAEKFTQSSGRRLAESPQNLFSFSLTKQQAGLLRERSIAQAGEPSIANFQQKIMRAESAQKSSLLLPRPMLRSKNFDFSFSGLKTAVLYLIRDLGGIKNISEETKSKIALEFENAAMECLVYKTAKAIETYKVKTLIVAGGVSANKYLKSEMKKITKHKVKLLFPTKELSGDNSIMIGIAGYLNYVKLARRGGNKKGVNNLKATGGLRL